ncbi:DNA polymerase III subunit delta' [Vibrio sp. Isolate24]|uniref:DNA polymerase III subunit delta' n=1 Tax=Vibrio sp. Isolate24 TaxID=2908534 RepID=UPI001EFE7EA8|nr:DNA polymerase III subunit delta' [Vibrio sp. Isolate24]MCG9679677.1 DNA polymerase III subunit delta' [Vibrio sp. Isolate24]
MQALYPWLTDIWQEWQLSLEAERFSNATLLAIEEGLGAEQLVEKFSNAVMCSNYVNEACGFCHSCQLMQANNHPDFHIVKPEKEGKAITVEQIRQCNRLAQESSQLSGVRLFIIEPAEAMNESAANALLKTLEEPSESCMFLLLSHKVHQLLPTITSRCQQWQVVNPEPEVVTQWLSTQVSVTIAPYVAHLNGNAPLKTQAFIEQDYEEKYLSFEAELLKVAQNMGDNVKLAKELASSPVEYLQWLWYLMTDAQKVHFGLNQPYFTPRAKLLAGCISYQILYRQTDTLSRLLDQLREHVGLNSELLILDWLFRFNEESCS